MSDADHLWQPQPIDSVEALLKCVDEIRLQLGRDPNAIAWRGMAKSQWVLRTTLDRDIASRGLGSDYRTLVAHERPLLEVFRHASWTFASDINRIHLHATDGEAIWPVMAIARHAGLPTRILDWTRSPSVAAFFACMEQANDGGVVWWFSQADLERVLAANWDTWGVPTVHRALRLPSLTLAQGAALCLDNRVLSATAFEDHGAPWLTKVHFGPGHARMEAQHGFMTLCGRIGLDHNLAIDKLASLGPIRRGTLLVPARLKSELLDWLRLMNVDATSLMYPAIDNIARSIATSR